MWIFGYGSLIWKIDFPYKSKVVGYVQNYIRRFWQGSEDHRGVPGKPGRVVTIVESKDPSDLVWGVAYEIAEEKLGWVKDHLDRREKGGYRLEPALFTPVEELYEPFKVEIYIGSKDNPNYLGPAEDDEMALQISASQGVSGSNADYLFELARAMKDIAPHATDAHLFGLERKVKDILTNEVDGREVISGGEDGMDTAVVPDDNDLTNVGNA